MLGNENFYSLTLQHEVKSYEGFNTLWYFILKKNVVNKILKWFLHKSTEVYRHGIKMLIIGIRHIFPKERSEEKGGNKGMDDWKKGGGETKT